MTESLHVLQNDHVALALRFSSVAGTTTPRSQVWTLSAGSHGEAKQWLDALAALGVPASCASGSGGIVDESDRESGVGPSSCQIGCLWLRITVHSFCAALGPCVYEIVELTTSPVDKVATAWRVGLSWLPSASQALGPPPPLAACALGAMALDHVAPTLRAHGSSAPGSAEAAVHNMYRCVALDMEAAAMSDWAARDAHEFALATPLGVAFLLDAAVASTFLYLDLRSMRPDAITRFVVVVAAAFLRMLLAYALLAAARWQPPAIRCACTTVVPSAAYRLLALVVSSWYAASSAATAGATCVEWASTAFTLDPVGDAVVAPPSTAATATAGHSMMGLQRVSIHGHAALRVGLFATNAVLNLLAAAVIAHRLHVQWAVEDGRRWFLIDASPPKPPQTGAYDQGVTKAPVTIVPDAPLAASAAAAMV